MDFIRVAHKEDKEGKRTYYPSLQAIESQDLVIRGGQFVAVWDEDTGLYSRTLPHMPEILDRAFARMVGDRLRPGDTISKFRVYENQLYTKLMGLIRNIGDMGPELDQRLVFANERPEKKDAATFVLPYSLSSDPAPSWSRILDTLYNKDERLKIEWAIGSIFAGASKEIQKFYVFYGPPGTGKSTVMNIIEMLFEGHTSEFSASDMGNASSQFSLEPFAKNPLVAIAQDDDLSRVEVNKNLNSVVSHDRVLINCKGKSVYSIRPRATLFIGTNDPVKISNRKSGLFRRLIDIHPTGKLLPESEYHHLMASIKFELGAIANHCLEVFNRHGHTYFSSYRSTEMMYRTNDIFNFVQDNRLFLRRGVTLKQAHKLYGEWCEETGTRNVYKQYQFRDLLADYFDTFHEQVMVDGVRHRSFFEDLKDLEQFIGVEPEPKPKSWLELREGSSLLDDILAEMPAQPYTGNPDHPLARAWVNTTSVLKDLDTSEEHYVKVPTQHIVIDFDLKDEDGRKSLQRNLDAASNWPPTYAEVSRGGGGLHLHYDYSGDPGRLSNVDVNGGFEVKTLLGDSSLRRRVTLSNTLPVATISAGLPFKEDKVISERVMRSERGLRALVLRGLNKEVHQYTKPSIDFIKQVLDDAERSGMEYDISDMADAIYTFALTSSNQRERCLEIAAGLKLKSGDDIPAAGNMDDSPIVDFDIEVYPNVNLVGWLPEGGTQVSVMVNPTPQQAEDLLKMKLNGYNCRMYDNHILWAISLGYSPADVYALSQSIVSGDRNAWFGAAFNASYSDLYDLMSEKRSLKWWEIQLGLPHMEMDLPWDQPVPEERMEDVVAYLKNDVLSTQALRHAREADFRAREILAELSGLQVINTNNQHTAQLVFGDIKDTKGELEYTDLSEMFPGYTFNQFHPGKDKSSYRGESPGEGGYVYSEPGYYENVALLDVASMHPTSIVELNLFGSHTRKFKQLLDIRLAIKNRDFEAAINIDPRLEKYLADQGSAKALSDALKIVINSVYGLTAAKFDNRFRDPRNVDNIVAKRGALFMLDLKAYLSEMGVPVAHIKTDSVKIPDATEEIIEKVIEFGARYGYSFEHEETYEKFCLLNDAVYVAKHGDTWEAVGAQYQHPVVFKSIFTKEPVEQKDYVEVKQVVKGDMYLVSVDTDTRSFVGRFGAFVPVVEGRQLMRIDGEKSSAVTGTKGYLWELDEVAFANNLPVDMTYFQDLIAEGVRNLEKHVQLRVLTG